MTKLETLLLELLRDERWEGIRGMPHLQAKAIVSEYARRIEEMQTPIVLREFIGWWYAQFAYPTGLRDTLLVEAQHSNALQRIAEFLEQRSTGKTYSFTELCPKCGKKTGFKVKTGKDLEDETHSDELHISPLCEECSRENP